jgi:dsRNA-specific ribonuclease
LLSAEFLNECKLTDVQISNLDMMSKVIMDSAHPEKWSLASAALPYMAPPVPFDDIGHILDRFRGSDAASDILNQTTVKSTPFQGGLIMHQRNGGTGMPRSIFRRFADKSDQIASSDRTLDYRCLIVVTKFPKRKDFHVFRKFADHDRLDYTKEVILPVEECVVTRLPAEYSLCALFIPSLLRRLELAMVVEELNRTILRSLEIQSLSLLQVAITSRSAGEQENYQRLEFFGDCVLKLIITVQLMHEYKDWPEDFLTIAKSHKVSNATLAKACLDTGLHGFIIEKAYKSKGWFPIYTEGRSPLPKRVVSTKLLADVVEAIIGASYMDGGLQRAHKCIQIFLPSKKWVSFEDAIESLFSESTSAPVHLDDLEALVGYKFVKPSILLEATTHPSFHSYTEDRLKSYQRLEFLGDSLLDYLLVQRVFSHEVELGDGTMTVIRASLANSWLLGFLCLEATMPKEIFDIRRGSNGASVPQEKQTETALWQFMRQGISEIAVTQGATADLHQKLRSQINTALAESATFPWDLLAQLNPGKFYSDLIESVLGAIFVDSQGDMTHCSAFLDRLGLWVLLDRILDEKVNCQHPKHRLGIAVGNKSVKYNYDEWNKDKTLPMEIFIGERRVGESGVKVTGNTKSVMETLAASQALAILQLPSKVPAAPEEFRDASMDDAVVGEAIAFDEEGDVSMDDDN